MNDTPEAAVQTEGTEKLTEIAQYNLSNNKGNDEEEQQYEIEITREKHSAIKKEIKTSNSSMTDYVKLSPNCNSPRQDQIRKITKVGYAHNPNKNLKHKRYSEGSATARRGVLSKRTASASG